MDTLLLAGMLLLNVLISIWNCYAVGSAWKDTMTMGSGFNKFVLWSAVIQSGVGFSMPLLLGLTLGSLMFLTSGTEPYLSQLEAEGVRVTIMNLWYVVVIFPILGSGLAIWAHSLQIAYQRRDFGSIAAAGWNSFAQIHNTVSAVENLGGAFGNVSEFFGAFDEDIDTKGKLTLLIVLLVSISIVGGFMIAFGLVRYFARTTESRIEEYAYNQGRELA